MAVPSTLNGYKVTHQATHANCSTVMVERPESSIRYVVATWSENLADGWKWGHYISDFNEALEVFIETADRNARR